MASLWGEGAEIGQIVSAMLGGPREICVARGKAAGTPTPPMALRWLAPGPAFLYL